MASSLPKLPIFEALTKHERTSTAIVHSASGRTFTYGSLIRDVAAAKDKLQKLAKNKSIQGERIAFLAENGYDYVVIFLAILANNAIALPLSQKFPSPEIRYILENSGASLFISTAKFEDKARDVLSEDVSTKPQLEILPKLETGSSDSENVALSDEATDSGGFMLFTSGTTSRPKGVVLSTNVITAQAKSLVEAWQYSPSDLLLHVLPMHHIHGTLNALFTPLMAGAAIEFEFPFSADGVWERFAAPFKSDASGTTKRPVTFFTAVPTIYSKLLDSYKPLDDATKAALDKALSPDSLRLNISGSAALPTPIKKAWSDVSKGNVLLERYGMTEVGMALSCGLEFSDRVDGSVGWALPSVQVRLMDTETGEVIEDSDQSGSSESAREGEIQLRGPTIFKGYWQNAKATTEEFVEGEDGQGKWFKTGDVAVRHRVAGAGESQQKWAQGPMYFIRGRKSVDIIKTGGEKVSALEVEREMLSLPYVSEVAVVGVPSDKWGQKVAAVAVLTPEGKTAGKNGKPWSPLDMRRSLKDKLSAYKIPQELKVVDELPRNAMGKINKKTLVKEIFGDSS